MVRNVATKSTKVDYQSIEAEYVSSDLSLRELARRAGLSNSTLSEYARHNDWEQKRSTFRMQVARRTYEKVADGVSDQAAEIELERVMVLRASLRMYAQQLSKGEVALSARDAVLISTELARIMGEPTGATNGGTVISVNQAPDEPLLRAILEASREHVAQSEGLGGVAGDRSEGPRLN